VNVENEITLTSNDGNVWKINSKMVFFFKSKFDEVMEIVWKIVEVLKNMFTDTEKLPSLHQMRVQPH